MVAAAAHCFSDSEQMHRGFPLTKFQEEVNMECSIRTQPKIKQNELLEILEELEGYKMLKLDKKNQAVELICEPHELQQAIQFVDSKALQAATAE